MKWFIKEKYEFPSVVEINGKEFQIKVDFLKKRSSSAQIKGETLVFRLSYYLRSSQVNSHFEELLQKLIRRVQTSKVFNYLSFKDVIEKGYFDFHQRRFRIERTQKSRFSYKENVFFIPLTANLQSIERKVIKILLNIYLDFVHADVLRINNETYRFLVKDVELKLVESKWGHCSHNNVIMINLKLLNAPKEIREYVIIHELAHIKHKNHSSVFWAEVAKHCPNYKDLRKILKDSPPQLYL